MEVRDELCGFISIHALREEGDAQNTAQIVKMHEFLSTPSARRATFQPPGRPVHLPISIHALREEGDAAVGVPPFRLF